MWVAGDQTCIDGTDRRTDDPVWFDSVFMKRVIDASLVGPERASALQDKDDLTIFLFLSSLDVRKLRHAA
jgi:hypothetical protein